MTERAWSRVSRRDPCPVCGRPDWCSVSPDGAVAACRRSSEGPRGSGRERQDRDGGTYWLHRLDGEQGRLVPPPPPLTSARTSATVVARAYAAILGELGLAQRHHDQLRERGLTDAEIALRGYRTLPLRGRARLARAAVEAVGPEAAAGVPGLYVAQDGERTWWSLAGAPGLLVPVRGVAGHVVALSVRADDPETARGKYTWVSSTRRGGASPGAPCHVPLRSGLDASTVRLTEGALKADVATALSATVTIGSSSASTWRPALAAALELRPRRLLVAWDADWRDKPEVAAGLVGLLEALLPLRAAGLTVLVETWDPAAGKGIDDMLAHGHLLQEAP